MNITKQVDGTEATLVVKGRIDTTTAPELEAQVASLADVKSLTFDFKGLDYISSAGLRVLLKTQKTIKAAGGTLTLKNVCDEVMEVFDITGFSDILNIVK